MCLAEALAKLWENWVSYWLKEKNKNQVNYEPDLHQETQLITIAQNPPVKKHDRIPVLSVYKLLEIPKNVCSNQ